MPASNPALLMLILAAGIFIVAAAFLVGELWSRDQRRIGDRIREEFGENDHRQRRNIFQSAEDVENGSWKQRLHEMLQQSGLQFGTRTLLFMTAGSGLACGLPGWVVTGSELAAATAVLLASAIPIVYVRYRQLQRREALRAQLPDVLDLMSRVVRAGQSMPQAIQGVAEEFPAPLGTEFAWCLEQQKLGYPLEDALRDLSRRCGLPEVKIFVLAILVQRQSGGSLTELLAKLARLTRERFRIQGVIRTLTAEGRMQAGVLMVLPVAVFGMMMAIHPEYARVLLDRKYILAVMAGFEIVGAVWIKKIVNVDI